MILKFDFQRYVVSFFFLLSHPTALSRICRTHKALYIFSCHQFFENSKLLSCRYNMDTNRVEARFADGSAVAIDCVAIEDKYGNTPTQRAELEWLLCNRPLEYAQLVLGGEMEHYLSLGCDHGRLED